MPSTLLALLLLLSTRVAAEEQSGFSEAIEVHVATIDVVVTDREGRHVPGLTRDDFRLLEDRREVPISNFSEYRGEPAAAEGAPAPQAPSESPSPQPPRRAPATIVVFVDNLSLRFRDRGPVMDQLRHFLRDSIEADDRLMVVTWNLGLHTVVPFGSTPEKVDVAVDRLLRTAAGGEVERMEREEMARRAEMYAGDAQMLAGSGGAPEQNADNNDAAYADATSTMMSTELRMRATVSAIRATITKIAGAEGRKCIVLITEGLARNAAQPAIDRNAILQPPSTDPRGNLTEYVDKLTAFASAAGVALYPIHAAGMRQVGSEALSGGSAGSMVLDTARVQESLSTLTTLAEQTGGSVASGPAALPRFLGDLRADLDSYYSLGYRVSSRGTGAHSIRVEVRNRELQVRTRRTVAIRTPEEKLRDELTSRLFDARTDNPLKARVEFREARRSGRGEWRVPVRVIVPFTALTFLPEASGQTVAFSVASVASENMEWPSKVHRESKRLQIPAGRAAAMRGQSLAYDFEVLTRGRGGRMVVGFSDDQAEVRSFVVVDLPRLEK